MTTFRSPSSSETPTNPPPQISTTPSRPFPPPCWSQEETASLIDAYRDKWYSLRRGNLRASDWQEVADDVANRCALSSGHPPKTSTQCRHKMEKLRKRYRTEIQRAAGNPKTHRNPSSWVHFNQMDSMENGSNTSPDPATVSPHQNEESEQRDRYRHRFRNLIDHVNRVKIPGQNQIPPPDWGKPGYDVRDWYGGGGRRRVEVVGGGGGNPVTEMVAAIKKVGEGFVRIERMKMEMVQELESMRLEMEMKRTEMIIQSHRWIADSFYSPAKKKLKTMVTPES